MIKYSVIKYNNTNKCIISEKDIWYYKKYEMNTSRLCLYFENQGINEIYEEDLFDSIDTNFKIENYVEQPLKFVRAYFDNDGGNTSRFIRKEKEFKEDEDILPYLISRFGLNNIFIETDDKLVKFISSGFYKSYERDKKINEILNKIQ